MRSAEYDPLADVYDAWCEGDRASGPCREFYAHLGRDHPGRLVELGVGTGRILLDWVRAGNEVIGVDLSSAMLRRCRDKLLAAGAEGRVRLVAGDFIELVLDAPADLIACPFRTIGHLLTWDDRRALLRAVRRNLVPGGRFVFDHYVFDAAWARAHDRVPRLMSSPVPGAAGAVVWDTYDYDFDAHTMRCLITIERVEPAGRVASRTHVPLSFSWFEPEAMRAALLEEGFEVEAIHGGFAGEPFGPRSEDQVWFARRPGAGIR